MSYLVVQRDPKQIKRDVRGTVLCVLAFMATMNIVAAIVMIVGAFVDHPELISQYGMQNYTTWYLEMTEALLDANAKYAGLASLLGMACGLPWFFIIRGKRFVTTDVTKTNSKVKISTLLFLFLLILGIQGAMTLFQVSFEPFFEQGDASLTDVLDEAMVNLGTSFFGILYIVFLGPLFEELVFRGAVMRSLEKYGANFALIVSSLLFGLYHIFLFQAAFAFFVGLILGYTAGRFSLKWAVLLHMLNNSMAVISLALGSPAFDTALTILFIVAFVASVILVIVFRQKFALQKIAGAPSEARVYQRAFSSPWLICYIVLCVLGGITMLFGV